MTRTIKAHFDGRAIIPDRPVRLPIGTQLRVRIELDPTGNGKPVGRPGRIVGVGRFRSGIPDLATNKKHLDGFGRS